MKLNMCHHSAMMHFLFRFVGISAVLQEVLPFECLTINKLSNKVITKPLMT